MDILFLSIGFAGVILLVYRGIVILFDPPRNKIVFFKKNYPFVFPAVLILISILFALFNQNSHVTIGEHLRIKDISTVLCNHLWEKTFDGMVVLGEDTSTSQLVFSFFDEDNFENRIVITSGSVENSDIEKECRKMSSKIQISHVTSVFHNDPVEITVCSLKDHNVSGLYFQYVMRDIPVLFTIISRENMIEEMKEEAECLVKKF